MAMTVEYEEYGSSVLYMPWNYYRIVQSVRSEGFK
jgi:hypothetical protein